MSVFRRAGGQRIPFALEIAHQQPGPRTPHPADNSLLGLTRKTLRRQPFGVFQPDLDRIITALEQADLEIACFDNAGSLLVNDLAPSIDPKKGALETLTRREMEVMGYIIRGYSNREIAEALYISVRTVESHRANLFGKLGLKNRAELVEFAEKYGLRD